MEIMTSSTNRLSAHSQERRNLGCLPFARRIWLRCRKHNGNRLTSLLQNCHIRYGLNPRKGEFEERESGTEKEPINW